MVAAVTSTNNAVFSWIEDIYAHTFGNQVHLGNNQFYIRSNTQFMQFNLNANAKQCTTGLKIHYSIAEQDLEKATKIIADKCAKHNIGMFKVIKKPFPSSSAQYGKDFTIYIGPGQDNPEALSKFLNDLDAALEQNNIRPNSLGKNIQKMDRAVKGSKYAHYRFDRDPATGQYFKGSFKVPKGYTDPFKQVEVKTSLNRMNTNVREKAPAPARSANEGAWKNIKSWKNLEGHAYYDNYNSLTAAEKFEMEVFLKSHEVPYKKMNIKHHDGSITEALKIEENSKVFAKKLANSKKYQTVHVGSQERAREIFDQLKEKGIAARKLRTPNGEYYIYTEAKTKADNILKANGVGKKVVENKVATDTTRMNSNVRASKAVEYPSHRYMFKNPKEADAFIKILKQRGIELHPDVVDYLNIGQRGVRVSADTPAAQQAYNDAVKAVRAQEAARTKTNESAKSNESPKSNESAKENNQKAQSAKKTNSGAGTKQETGKYYKRTPIKSGNEAVAQKMVEHMKRQRNVDLRIVTETKNGVTRQFVEYPTMKSYADTMNEAGRIYDQRTAAQNEPKPAEAAREAEVAEKTQSPEKNGKTTAKPKQNDLATEVVEGEKIPEHKGKTAAKPKKIVDAEIVEDSVKSPARTPKAAPKAAPKPVPEAPAVGTWGKMFRVGGSVLSGVGAFAEGAEAAKSFEEGDVGEGIYHSANSAAFGAASVGVFVGGTTATVTGAVAGFAGAGLLAREAYEDAKKGHYSSSVLETAGALYFGHASLTTSLYTSVGASVTAAPVVVTTAAVAGSAAIGWKAGRWVEETFLEPSRNYSMNVEDSAKLVGDQMKNVALGAQPAYLAGFMNYFNDDFDTTSAGWSISAQWNRFTTSNESRKQELMKNISKDPQAAYDKGVRGLGGTKGIGANAFLIYEAVQAGAKPRGFDDLPRKGTEMHAMANAVKSDISQIFYMNVSQNDSINDIAQAKTAAYLIKNGAGYTVDDLMEAARCGNDLMSDALLLSVRDKQTGQVRMLYDMNDEGEWHYSQPTATEEFVLPDEMKTQENMNAYMREAIKAKEVTPLKFSAVQQAFNNNGEMQIAEDVLVPMLTESEKYFSQDNVGETQEEKQQAKEKVLTVMCGSKETGYRFQTWEMTPAVVSAVKQLDPERKEAFIQYAKEKDLGKDNPEIQAELEQLSPETFTKGTEKVSWTVQETIEGPTEHVYKNPVAYERAHARLNGEMYRNVKQKPRYNAQDREQMLQNIREMEEKGLLPKGQDGRSNAEVYLYKLQQVNNLSYDKTQVVVNDEKMSFGEYISDGGKNPTARGCEKLLKKKDLTPEEQDALAATLKNTENIVDDDGRMLMAVHGGNNYSYNKDGDKNFEQVDTTHTVTREYEQEITGTKEERENAVSKIAEENGVKVERTPAAQAQVANEGAEHAAGGASQTGAQVANEGAEHAAGDASQTGDAAGQQGALARLGTAGQKIPDEEYTATQQNGRGYV